MLRVRLLGRPRLAYGDASISAAARPKVVPLLAYLLLHRSAAAARRTIAGALWPEHSDDEARANLRRHLNYVQHLLPEPPAEQPWILASTADVQWNPAAPLDFDVESFERLAATAQGADAALALYEGDLLPDADEEWLAPHRERLRARFVETLAEQLSRLRAAGDRACAIAAAQRLLAADPWREDALRTLMKLRYESGDRAGALGELERFARLLRNELGVEPMPETRALGEAITRDEVPAEPVPHARAAPARHDALHVLPFCGRAYELEMLAQYARAAAGGHGALVLIGGETGIGKTRLTRELAAVAERGGAQVYSAAPGDPETIPYQPFADVLRAAAPLLTLVQLNPSPSAALGTLAPALLAYAPDAEPLPAVEPARERVRLFEACSDAWAALASRRPVVLIVEDLHRAGPGTIGLLEHLARRAGAAPILLVGTYREDDLGFSHPLRAARRRLEYDGLAHHLALPRLNADSVAELVRTLGDQGDVATVARALHARSDGNPFYLEEMLRDLNEAGRLQLDNGRWSFDGAAPSAVPVAAREAIASRAARLSPQAAALLDVAAIAGDAFDTELLREATGWLEAAVLDALGTLIDRRIVVTQRPGAHAEYAFASSVIRTVVYDAIPEAIRARRHRRVAAVMTQLYEDRHDEVALQLALHWERGREPEAAAEEFVRAARRALGAFANEEADAHLERALHFAAGRRLRFEALMLREGMAAARGDRDAQTSMLQSLGALAHEIDDEDAICAVLDRRLALADVTGARRSQHVLLRLLERRVRRSGEARWKRDALQARARYLRAINDFDGARAAFEEVMVLTEQTGDRETLAAARLAYADTYIYEGRLDEARAALTDLRVALDAASNRGALVRTLMSFARAALVQQDYGAMSHFAEEAHRISRAIGDREGEALALHTLANGLVYTFRVDEAREQYQRALEIYERIWHRVGIASICVDLGLFHTELGLLDRALELFARARTVAEEIGFRWVSCVEAIDRSYCLRLQHALPEAKAAAEYALAVAGEIRSQPLLSAALGTLGCAESALGAHHDAIAHLEEGVALRREAGPTPRLGDNLCALTLAYLRSGDPEAAAAPAAELLALYEANPKLAPQPTEWLGAIAHAERRVGREHQANALLRRADSVMRARAAAIGDADARAAFLALPFNREVTEALAVGV